MTAMIFFKDDYTIAKVLEAEKSREQILIEMYAGTLIPKDHAESLWGRVLDHKWYISEILGRDVGFKVATIDYFENIHELRIEKKRSLLSGIRFVMPNNSATVV